MVLVLCSIGHDFPSISLNLSFFILMDTQETDLFAPDSPPRRQLPRAPSGLPNPSQLCNVRSLFDWNSVAFALSARTPSPDLFLTPQAEDELVLPEPPNAVLEPLLSPTAALALQEAQRNEELEEYERARLEFRDRELASILDSLPDTALNVSSSSTASAPPVTITATSSSTIQNRSSFLHSVATFRNDSPPPLPARPQTLLPAYAVSDQRPPSYVDPTPIRPAPLRLVQLDAVPETPVATQQALTNYPSNSTLASTINRADTSTVRPGERLSAASIEALWTRGRFEDNSLFLPSQYRTPNDVLYNAPRDSAQRLGDRLVELGIPFKRNYATRAKETQLISTSARHVVGSPFFRSPSTVPLGFKYNRASAEWQLMVIPDEE
jgi:hypothetical protein